MLGGRRPAGRRAHCAALGGQRLARPSAASVDRVAVGGVDDRAEQLAAAAWGRPRAAQASASEAVQLERSASAAPWRRRARRPAPRRRSPIAERLAADGAARRRLRRPPRAAGEHVAGQAPLGLAQRRAGASARAPPRRRPAAGSAARSRRARRSRGRSRPRPAAVRARARAPGARARGRRPPDASGTNRGLRPGRPRRCDGAPGRHRGDRLVGELAAEPLAGESLPAGRRGSRPCRRSRRRARARSPRARAPRAPAARAALDRDPALQHLVLLVDEAREGLLGDRDERQLE